MKIYEILNGQYDIPTNTTQQPASKPEEGPDGQFDADNVDDNLKQISNNIDDQNAQPEPIGGQGPEDADLDDSNVEPIDSALLSKIRSLPYNTKYDFNDKSPLAPLNIAAMEIADLSNLANQVKFKMQTQMLNTQVGSDDNDTLTYCNDLLRFINTVLTFKKGNSASQISKISATPSYQTMKKKS